MNELINKSISFFSGSIGGYCAFFKGFCIINMSNLFNSIDMARLTESLVVAFGCGFSGYLGKKFIDFIFSFFKSFLGYGKNKVRRN